MDDHDKDLVRTIIKDVLSDHIGETHKALRGQLNTEIKLEFFNRTGRTIIFGDRKMRTFIENLRATDLFMARVCSSMADGGGYWIAQTRAELLENLKQDRNRIIATYRRIRAQRINSVMAFDTDDFRLLKQVGLFEYATAH